MRTHAQDQDNKYAQDTWLILGMQEVQSQLQSRRISVDQPHHVKPSKTQHQHSQM